MVEPVTALESASDVIVGGLPYHAVAMRATPLMALEQALLPAVARPPCVVSFSGGMDSSFVLAVATRLARREGLPLPVPVTWRFAGAPRAYETPWQERVVRELGLADWTVLAAGDDLDLVGPVARRLLTRHGYRHPPNLHLHLPIVELAVGGSLLTGVGGDQVLSGWRRPTALRAWKDRIKGRDGYPWLRPAVSRQVSALLRAERRAQPRRLDRRIAWHGSRRRLLLTCAGLAALGDDVAVVNPLVDPGFEGALPRGVPARAHPRVRALVGRIRRRRPVRRPRRPAYGVVAVADPRRHRRTRAAAVACNLGRSGMTRFTVGGPGVAWRETGGEIVVLDLDGSVYFGVNGTGALLWKRLVDGADAAELSDVLVQAAQVPPARAAADVDAFLAELRRHGLLAAALHDMG